MDAKHGYEHGFMDSQYGSPRLDSWDLENLQYIRKKSQNGLFLEEYSLPEELELLALEHERWEDQGADDEKNGKLTVVTNIQPEFHTRLEDNKEQDAKFLIHAKDEVDERRVPPEVDQLPSFVDPSRSRLDDCYLLDVLTIGNDSVLKDQVRSDSPVQEEGYKISTAKASPPPFSSARIPRQIPFPNPRKVTGGGSMGTASNSPYSSTSGDDEESEYMASSSYSSRTDDRECQLDLSSPETCPLCSDGNSSRGSGIFNAHPESLQKRMEPDWRSNSSSPYYVRLRRDLRNMSPLPTTPTRFGVDKQGQLVIDYSHNWNGLELYIKQLHLA